MAKQKKHEVPPSRKKMARVEREQLYNRIITITAGTIILAVIVMVVGGVIINTVITPKQPVVTVGEEEILTREFQLRVKYERLILINNMMTQLNNLELFADSPDFQAQIISNINQIQFQLDPLTVANSVINKLVEERLILKEAERLGFTVTEGEVDEILKESFGYFPDGRPTSTPLPTTAPTSTLSPTQLTLITITPTPTLIPTSTVDIQIEPTAESTPEDEGEPTPTSEPLPTSTPYTLEAYQENYKDYVDLLNNEIGFKEENLRNLIKIDLYRNKLLDELTVDLTPEQDMVWARHILVDDEETANLVLNLIEGGGDFAELAAEYSTDGSSMNGGDLGWFNVTAMVQGFSEVAFNTPIGIISDPVQTEFGWHIIQVLGHEIRPMDSYEFEQFREEKFQEWLERAIIDSDWVKVEGWEEVVPDEPPIPLGVSQYLQQFLNP
jgi:parvulin-like peptidyl-prolyl isomerase